MKISRFNSILAAAAVALLSACGGEGGEISNVESLRLAGGIYTGTLEDANTGTTHTLQAAIDEEGTFVFVDVSHPTVYTMQIVDFQTSAADNFFTCYTGKTFDGYLFPDGTNYGQGAITGTFQVNTGVDGLVIGPKAECSLGNDNPPISDYHLDRDGLLYEADFPFTSIAGTYDFQVGNKALTWVVDANGQVTGNDDKGCAVYEGALRRVASGANMFRVDVTSYCGATIRYDGLAYVIPAISPEPQKLWIAITAPAVGHATPSRE